MNALSTLERWRRRAALAFTETGWLAIAAACLALAGMAFWLAGAWLDAQAHLIRQGASQGTSGQLPTALSSASNASRLSELVASREWYLDDVESVFGLANQNGIQIAGFAYDREVQRVGMFEVQGLSLRMKGDYPKLKAFLAGLMAASPHSYLSDLRLERGSPTASSLDATLKISFIYRAKGVTASEGPGVPRTQTSAGPQ